MTRKDVTVERCVDLFDNGMNIKQIASYLACSTTLVSHRLKSAGKKTSNKEQGPYCKASIWCCYASGDTMQKIMDRQSIKSFKTIERSIDDHARELHNKAVGSYKIDESIKRLNAGGLSDADIARKIGIHQTAVSKRRRKLGLSVVKQYNYSGKNNRVGQVFELEDGNSVTVVSYKGMHQKSTLMCNTCGCHFERLMSSIVRGHVKRCPHCYKNKLDEEWWSAEKYQPELRLTYSTPYENKIDLDEVVECAECGKKFRVGDVYFGSGRKPSCCSKECSVRSNRRNASHKRRLRAGTYERIDWHKVFERDGGRCYICGKETDSTDFVINENGHFIAGPDYPSVDHVVPLSKGGSHTMDNARLACRMCNSLKRDRTDYSIEVSA